MNTQSNAMATAATEPRAAVTASISGWQRLTWCVRRELWEYRSIYLAPLVMAGIVIFGALITLGRVPGRMRLALAADAARQHAMLVQHYHFAALLIMGTAMVVGIFYSADALHGERRDRSILFWKSLPVSDLTTVLAKASVAIVILPLLAFAIGAVVNFVQLLLSSAALFAAGMDAGPLWREVAYFRTTPLLLYHMVTIHMLWHAPIYAWLLLVSSWARRMTFLWAALPFAAIAIFEKITWGTTYFAMMLLDRLSGGEASAGARPDSFPGEAGTHLMVGHFLTNPGLWIGLVFAAGCLYGAARLRKSKGPI
jgi:ABC-2 type transport system permease protein